MTMELAPTNIHPPKRNLHLESKLKSPHRRRHRQTHQRRHPTQLAQRSANYERRMELLRRIGFPPWVRRSPQTTHNHNRVYNTHTWQVRPNYSPKSPQTSCRYVHWRRAEPIRKIGNWPTLSRGEALTTTFATVDIPLKPKMRCVKKRQADPPPSAFRKPKIRPLPLLYENLTKYETKMSQNNTFYL